MYDYVVVGAGPAGSRFAQQAATGGDDVLVLERGEIGRPLACSGHVSTDIWDYLPEGARDEILQNEIIGARFHVDGPGSRSYRFYRDDPISNVIDRVGLDRTLATAAVEAGAEIRTRHTVTGIETEADHVRIRYRIGGTIETVRAAMVVGCDGPGSRVRTALGLADPVELLTGLLGFDQTSDSGDYVDVHLIAPRFFAWRIPRGDAGVEYGLAAPPNAIPRDRFDRFTAAYGATIETVCSGAIPIGPPDRVTGSRGLLIGDAAAQTKPFTGGGILYGMRAADHAVDTVDPHRPQTLEDYEAAWRADLAREIRLGGLLRRCYSLPAPLQHLGLRLLAGRIGVHMDRPSTLLSRQHLGAMFSRR